MIWVAWGISVVTLMLVMSVTLLILSRALTSAQGHADRLHERATKQLDTVLDRFMALDFAVFKQYQLAEHAPEGGFEEPAPEKESWEDRIRPFAGVQDQQNVFSMAHRDVNAPEYWGPNEQTGEMFAAEDDEARFQREAATLRESQE